MKHQKHPIIQRPTLNTYHKTEWAVYGTTCEKISQFFNELDAHLKPAYKLLYVDADHGIKSDRQVYQVAEKQFQLSSGYRHNEYLDRLNIIPSDGVIVNGNHYSASRQIIFLDPVKEDSLFRRLENINSIYAIIKMEEDQEVYDFLKERINDETKIFHISDIGLLYNDIEDNLKEAIPRLKALVLAGGKSTRMGEDKSQIKYNGSHSEEIRIAQLCQTMGLETHVSKSYDFEGESIGGFIVIKDRMVEMGPFGAILSAMMMDPDAAWLVLACDLPFIDETSLENLIHHRSYSLYATAFKASETAFPEPLIAIYEPKIYKRMLEFLSMGYACPRKVLINSDIRGITIDNGDVIRNVNNQEEKQQAITDLAN